MTEKDCKKRIEDLTLLRNVYERLLIDIHSAFYADSTMKVLLKKTKKELAKLEEMLYNGSCKA